MKTNTEFLNEINIIYKKYPFLKNQNIDISNQLFKLHQFLEKDKIKEKLENF